MSPIGPEGKEWVARKMRVWSLVADGGVAQHVRKKRGLPEGDEVVVLSYVHTHTHTHTHNAIT